MKIVKELIIFLALSVAASVVTFKVAQRFFVGGTSTTLDIKLGDRVTDASPVYDYSVVLASIKGDPFCSGSVVDASYIVTAAHCIEYGVGKPVKIFTSNGVDTKVTGQVAATNSRLDYGIIVGNFSKFRTIKMDYVSIINLQDDKYLMSCGNPMGQKKMSCTLIRPYENQYFMVKARGLLYPGMSGGAVIDTATNTLVGVNSAVEDGYVLFTPVAGLAGAFNIEPRK